MALRREKKKKSPGVSNVVVFLFFSISCTHASILISPNLVPNIYVDMNEINPRAGSRWYGGGDGGARQTNTHKPTVA